MAAVTRLQRDRALRSQSRTIWRPGMVSSAMGIKFRAPRLATLDTRRVKPRSARAPQDHLGSQQHRRWAQAVLARAGGRCQWPGCEKPARYADHIKERRDAPELALSLDNGQALCPEHHSRNTLAERARRMRDG